MAARRPAGCAWPCRGRRRPVRGHDDAETRRRTPATRPVLHTSTGTALRINENRFGSLQLEITAMRLLDEHGTPVAEGETGDSLCVEMDYLSAQPIEAPIFGVTIAREDGMGRKNVTLTDLNTCVELTLCPRKH